MSQFDHSKLTGQISLPCRSASIQFQRLWKISRQNVPAAGTCAKQRLVTEQHATCFFYKPRLIIHMWLAFAKQKIIPSNEQDCDVQTNTRYIFEICKSKDKVLDCLGFIALKKKKKEKEEEESLPWTNQDCVLVSFGQHLILAIGRKHMAAGWKQAAS